MQPCQPILDKRMGGSHPVSQGGESYLALLANDKGECKIGAPCILQESQIEPDWNGTTGNLLSDKAMIQLLGRDKFFQYQKEICVVCNDEWQPVPSRCSAIYKRWRQKAIELQWIKGTESGDIMVRGKAFGRGLGQPLSLIHISEPTRPY